jgi:predicted permease
MLIFLGAYLHPLEGLHDPGAWFTAGLRLVGGFVVGYIAIIVLRLSPAVAEGVILASLAPPTTQALSLSEVGGNSPTSKAAATVGTLLSLIAILMMWKTGWEPA